MKNLYSAVYQQIQANQSVVLVTVIASSGSIPRGAGAKMAVFEDGSTKGTIGGGALEYKAQQMAKTTLMEKQAHTQQFRLAPNQAADLGMVCGGDVELYFQFIQGGDSAAIALFAEILAACNRNQNSWMLTRIDTPGTFCQQTIIGDDIQLKQYALPELFTNQTAIFKKDGRRYYIEPLQTAGQVFIFGGGHISKSLVPVLHPLGFRCIVIDDKPEFAEKVRFPLAEHTCLLDFQDFSQRLSIGHSDYIVIMTRGHANDFEVLVQALRTDARYIGMIGSRKKLDTTKEKLLAEGFTEADFHRVHAPIGLAIQAVTPEEIAISIAAELILVRSEKVNQ